MTEQELQKQESDLFKLQVRQYFRLKDMHCYTLSNNYIRNLTFDQMFYIIFSDYPSVSFMKRILNVTGYNEEMRDFVEWLMKKDVSRL